MIVHPLFCARNTKLRLQDAKRSIIGCFANIRNFPDRCSVENSKCNEDIFAELDHSLIYFLLESFTFDCAAVNEQIAELVVFGRYNFLVGLGGYQAIHRGNRRVIDDARCIEEIPCAGPVEEDSEVLGLTTGQDYARRLSICGSSVVCPGFIGADCVE